MKLNQKFGKYEIKKFIGAGATSDVYLAHDTEIERDVALKILKPALVSDQTSFLRFKAEAKAAGNLFHDNIATVLDLGELDGRYYIAMRYIEGMSLTQFLKQNGAMDWKQVKKLAFQIGSAIAYSHGKGFIHRDIKPSNILVDQNGNFVLSDFGLTRVMLDSGLTSTTGAVLGTPPYIPPEIWNGKEASAYSDQYSFACVLNEAITGVSLFSASTTQEIITRHLILPVVVQPYPVGIPENVNLIVEKALSKKPEERFADMKTLVDNMMAPATFTQIPSIPEVTVESVPSWPGVPPVVVHKPKKRKSIVFVVVILLVVLCLVGSLVANKLIRNALNLQKTETPTLGSTTDATQLIAPTSTIGSSTIFPTNTIQAPTISPTMQVAQVSDEQVQPSSGVMINMVDNGQTGIMVNFFWADGTPIIDQYVSVYTQKQDLSGHWVTDEHLVGGYTDNAGSIFFDVPAGQYIITSDMNGYNWGTASDVEGQSNVTVESGRLTQLVLRMSRLVAGCVFADGSICEDEYFSVYTQVLDISGQWVADQNISGGYTDNTGVYIIGLTPGNYVVSADFSGYNWGNATDLEGQSNVPLRSGQINQIIVYLGRINVVVKDSEGNPAEDAYVSVYFQQADFNGNPTSGDQIMGEYINNTGMADFDLIPGFYCIRIGDSYYYDIEVKPSTITTTDGNSQSFTQP